MVLSGSPYGVSSPALADLGLTDQFLECSDLAYLMGAGVNRFWCYDTKNEGNALYRKVYLVDSVPTFTEISTVHWLGGV